MLAARSGVRFSLHSTAHTIPHPPDNPNDSKCFCVYLLSLIRHFILFINFKYWISSLAPSRRADQTRQKPQKLLYDDDDGDEIRKSSTEPGTTTPASTHQVPRNIPVVSRASLSPYLPWRLFTRYFGPSPSRRRIAAQQHKTKNGHLDLPPELGDANARQAWPGQQSLLRGRGEDAKIKSAEYNLNGNGQG